MNSPSVRDSVQRYYGETLKCSADLKTTSCCTVDRPPPYIQDCLKNIHPAVLNKYYGCGLCLPDYDLTGLSVLDLGCGAGRDVYLASQLVGEKGRVVGLDMTESMLDTARCHQSYHAAKLGFDNVKFVHGYLEQLDTIESLKAGSFDVIISNCVLNLCPDKLKVLKSCHSLLKQGGEMYFSDVYASRRVPDVLRNDPVLWGECLSGALYWNDFNRMAKQAGFVDHRLVRDAAVRISNDKVASLIAQAGHGLMRFSSTTFRLFKIDALECGCEDYGQAVSYKGTIPRAASVWHLDHENIFETGRVVPVCGNTFLMLHTDPLKEHFAFYGSCGAHYGCFEGHKSLHNVMPHSLQKGLDAGGDCC